MFINQQALVTSMKQLKSCDLCGNKSFEFLFKGSDRRYKVKGKYFLYKCKKCGLIFINPQPNNKEISKHYPIGKYYSFKKKDQSKLKKLLYKIYYQKNDAWFLKLLFLPVKPLLRTTKNVISGKFLDVGCGVGNFLLLMKSFNMDCYGVEIGAFNRKFAKQNKLNIFKGHLKDAHYPNEYFDVITLNHVFEHISNPTETLKELYRIIKPKGTLIMGAPQSECLDYKLFGKYWVGLDVPRHLFTYSTVILKRYAKKIGFKVEKIRYNSTPFQFLCSLLYWINKYKKRPIYLTNKNFSQSKLLFLLFLPMSCLCNFFKIGDQVEIILTKLEEDKER